MSATVTIVSFVSISIVLGALAEYFYSKRTLGRNTLNEKEDNSSRSDRAFKIFRLLPAIDCEKCGFTSCLEFAAAAAGSPELINLCLRSSKTIKKEAHNIWGYSPEFSGNLVARVNCFSSASNCSEKYRYYGTKSCSGVKLLWEGNRECIYGCVGFHDCVRVCPVDAIEIPDDFLPEVNETACVGCGRCESVCPFSVLKVTTRDNRTYVRCQTKNPGQLVHKICSSGCISCMVCVKACPHRAIEHRNGAPVIISERCVNCGICVTKCPVGVIECKNTAGSVVDIIPQKCNMCGICSEICPTKAILGNNRDGFKVATEKCIGCGLCMGRCPKDAIVIKISE